MRDISQQVADYREQELGDTKFKPRVVIGDDSHETSRAAAVHTAWHMRSNYGGLLNAAGNTFIEAQHILADEYGELIRQRALSCLDELYPLDRNNPDHLTYSFREMILEHLVRRAGIPEERLISPDGYEPSRMMAQARFQNQMLAEHWTVAHIGVGPPGSPHFGLVNRKIDPKYMFWNATVDHATKVANAKDGKVSEYPGNGFTAGPGLISQTDLQIIMAHDDRKAGNVAETLLGKTDLAFPLHHSHFWPAVWVYLDKKAAAETLDRLAIAA